MERSGTFAADGGRASVHGVEKGGSGGDGGGTVLAEHVPCERVELRGGSGGGIGEGGWLVHDVRGGGGVVRGFVEKLWLQEVVTGLVLLTYCPREERTARVPTTACRMRWTAAFR